MSWSRCLSKFVVGAVAAAAIGAVSAGGALAQGVTLEDVVVEGNQRIEADTVRYYLALVPGTEVTPGEINAALRNLQETGLFEDVALELQEATLVVRVRERPFVNNVHFEGNEIIDDEALASGIRTRSRTVYSVTTVEADASRIVDTYARSGRLAAQVAAKYVELEDNRVDIVFEIDEGPVSRVRKVAFVGNRMFSDFTLRRVINSREAAWYRIFASTDLFDAGRLETDKALLSRYYAGRGYADFEVLSAVASLTESGTGFVLTFTVSEGPRYDFGETTLVSELPEVDSESLQDLIEFDPGDVFDAQELALTGEAMQATLERAGHPFVDVDVATDKNPEALTVDTTFRIVPAEQVYVERIMIDGNVRTLDSVIRREFTFAEGDAFNRSKLAATRRNLRALGFFRSVDLRVEDGSSPDRVVVQVEVEEQSTGSLSFGIGYSSVDKVVGSLTLTERNLLGRGQEIALSYETSDGGDLYRFAFTEPRYQGRDLAVGVDVYRREEDGGSLQTYDLTRTGVSPTVEFPLSDETRMQVNYLLESQFTDRVVGTSDLIRSKRGKTLKSSAGYRLVWDRRDDPLQPRSGTVLTLRQQLAGLGGDTRTISSEATGNYFTPLDRDATLIGSLKFWGGAVTKMGGYDLEAADRFNVGGSILRGFAYGGVGPRDPLTREAIGGKFYAIGSAELLSDVFLPEELGIRAGLFADVGTLWSLDRTSYTRASLTKSAYDLVGTRGGKVSCETEPTDSADGTDCTVTVDDGAEIRASGGAQLLWSSPVGPMRFIFASDIQSENHDVTESFRFIIGAPF